MTTALAYVRNGRLDILAANQLGHAVFSPIFANAARPANIARFIFIDPASQEFYVKWERLAGDTVALLRAKAGRVRPGPTYESMELTADVGLRLNAYTAEPGTSSQDSLNLLASWTAVDIAGQPQSSQTVDGA